jgi:hypothetical protein
MQTFTGWQYLLIDLANQFGLDKLLFEERIKWAEDNLDNLEALAEHAETKPLYHKAVMAIRDAQAGKASGHLVGFDGVCSGIQIMSVITGCEAGATHTGLVNPNVRADAYTSTTEIMNDILGSTVNISRKAAKQSLMTSFYGSKQLPKMIFGEDTEELNAFYQAAQTVAPGPWELLQDLLASWKPFALEHAWKLPDGFDARIKVMQKMDARIEVDELDHATFTYEFYENIGTKSGLSNAANVVHSIDAYVLRCIHRRCNYDVDMVNRALGHINLALALRGNEDYVLEGVRPNDKIKYYVDQYLRSNMVDVVILPYITSDTVHQLPNDMLERLEEIIQQMLEHKPFPVIAIHDEFKCHPNNMNQLRRQYANVLADLAESEILSDILNQLYKTNSRWVKKCPELGHKIRNSNYALS